MSPLTYSAMPLDRCSNNRKNTHWLKQEFSSDKALFCLIHEDQHLFSDTDSLHPIWFKTEQLPGISMDSCIFIGKDDDRSIFAMNANKLSDNDLNKLSVTRQWFPLREVASRISAKDASILATAKALIYWHKTHLYCGKCGAITQSTDAGHARKCTDNTCRNMNFPRTDPAVIMLVERMCSDGEARCLLGRQANWPTGMFSTLAGFVDPGETLEEAVIREVLEESNIQVIDPTYIRSQPWPFPASVMLGFTATAVSEEIDISKDSLQQARWFTRAELESFKPKEEDLPVDFDGYRISSADSISSYLITAWKNKEIGQF